MSRLRTALIAIIGLACVLGAAAVQADSSALKQKVDAVIDQAIAEDRIVGTVVLIEQNGKLVYERAAGLADKESRKPMQLDTQFRLSSVSKPIVTVAALALLDRRKIALDDPVTKWLPDFKPKLADGTTPTITIRQLLTHTAGLSYTFSEKDDGPYHQAQVSSGFDGVKIDLAEEMRRLASVPLFMCSVQSSNARRGNRSAPLLPTSSRSRSA
jgi:CubicO group peptidase (beta-lactamase class C family)